jgi:anti-sigma regulatory factor (Ser/Thr protein kinase)
MPTAPLLPPSLHTMRIDWLSKLGTLLQTSAFCLAVATLHYAFLPSRSYEVPMVYSLATGLTIWLLIDLGRHAFPSASETGWPKGLGGFLLPAAGIAGGFVSGTWIGDAWFGWSSWDKAAGQMGASILITALAGVGGTYYFYSRNKAQYLETRMSEARRHVSEARLKLLETQLEPHMLFNTLANLRVLIATDAPRAEAMLDHLVDYLRATLNASRAGTHSLQTEFDRLRDYLELMAVRMGPRLAYQLELPPALAQQSVPALLLQPLVENAIQHGLEPQVQGGRIQVRAQREGGNIVLDVEDSGVGLPALPPQGEGFGLAQVRERLAAAFEDNGHFDCTPVSPHGARIRITYPATSA